MDQKQEIIKALITADGIAWPKDSNPDLPYGIMFFVDIDLNNLPEFDYWTTVIDNYLEKMFGVKPSIYVYDIDTEWQRRQENCV